MYLSASVYGIWDARYGPSLLPMEPITATPTYVIPIARPRFSLNQFEMITWCGIGPERAQVETVQRRDLHYRGTFAEFRILETPMAANHQQDRRAPPHP